ncbi:MAG TPA: hydroxysqualene dehydroxylase HpnE, partial [Terriglobia bacterium]|nr:hydroxysqualene dehydroxylase HpnE [Terriglobia bacterium]
MPPSHVVVAGGGLAGLAASVALADNGIRVTLLEKNPRLGGRATSYRLSTGEYIDNCQHVTLRCCTNLEDFYRRTGVADKIHYYDQLVFSDSKRRRGHIKPSRLPAPFHLALSFAAFPLLSFQDKYSIARAMLRILRGGGNPQISNGITMLEWLRREKQTPAAIDRFWRVVLVSALNEDLDRTEANYGVLVFWKAFLSNPAAFGMGVPAVPLADLYATCSERIERNGGDVRTRCSVAEVCVSGDSAVRVLLEGGGEVCGDYYVLAVPFDRLPKLLPAEIRGTSVFANLANLCVSPITGVHMWFDQPVMSEPFLTTVDQTIQWIFNRTGQYVQIVISASRALSNRSQQEIVEICRRELDDLLPAAGKARLLRAVVIRESAATFSPAPGCDRWRPSQQTSIRNLFLAVDWTRTGWPATMESAVRSGYQAAEAILSMDGSP